MATPIAIPRRSAGSKTTTTTNGSTTATGGSSCTNPTTDADCAACADRISCFACWRRTHIAEEMIFGKYADCVVCTACSTVIQATAMDCPNGLPTMKDACDMGTAGDTTAISACVMCSQTGSCKPHLDACKANATCVAYNNGAETRPAATGG